MTMLALFHKGELKIETKNKYEDNNTKNDFVKTYYTSTNVEMILNISNPFSMHVRSKVSHKHSNTWTLYSTFVRRIPVFRYWSWALKIGCLDTARCQMSTDSQLGTSPVT